MLWLDISGLGKPAMMETIIRWELVAFLASATGIAGFQILTGKINSRGLLRTRVGGPLSPARVQMLFAAAGYGLWYLDQVRRSTDYLALPDIPGSVLLALAGSQSVYLLGKGFSVLNWQQYLKKNNPM